MTIPYNVIEWTTTQLPSQEKVDILQREINPFHQRYNLGIPKGQDGMSFNNIRIITPTAADDVVTIVFEYDEEGKLKRDKDNYLITTEYEGRQDDIDNQRKIWVADVTDYKVTDQGTKYLVYLGDYNIINDIKTIFDKAQSILYLATKYNAKLNFNSCEKRSIIKIFLEIFILRFCKISHYVNLWFNIKFRTHPW